MKDEIKGKADELKGMLTGDRSEEMKGKAEQAVDKARRTGRDIRDDVKDKKDDMDDEARERERERDAETVREHRSLVRHRATLRREMAAGVNPAVTHRDQGSERMIASTTEPFSIT